MLQPRHCALSLVGEPIMYPEINTLVQQLHARRISTFLVTNAQFPDRIRCAQLTILPRHCAPLPMSATQCLAFQHPRTLELHASLARCMSENGCDPASSAASSHDFEAALVGLTSA